MLKHSKRILALVGATAAVALVWAGLTLAKGPKPPPPPPPPGPSTGTIFFRQDGASGVSWLCRMDWDGQKPEWLCPGNYALGNWDVSHGDSPRFFIYTDMSQADRPLYVVNLSGDDLSPRPIFGSASFFAYNVALSRDDAKVAFVWGVYYDSYVYVADLVYGDHSGLPTGMTEPALVGYVPGTLVGCLTWSPDGSSIAFGGTPYDKLYKEGDIYVLSPVSPPTLGTITNITNTPGVIERDPEWSPDGNRIAYDAYIPGSPNPPGDIYTVHCDGSQRTLVVSGANTGGIRAMAPSWSPDGQQVAFFAFSSNAPRRQRYAVMRTAADGTTTPVNLTGWGEFFGSVKWRPGP